LENSEQLLVVYNYQPRRVTVFFLCIEEKKDKVGLKFDPEVGIGKNGFAVPGAKREGDSKSQQNISFGKSTYL
jgi:hypothetical protein